MRKRHAFTAGALGVSLALGGLTAVPAGATSTSEADSASQDLTVYLNPAATTARGSQAPTGLTSATAVPSFEDVERVLRQRNATRATVLIRGGTYYPTKEIEWGSYDPSGGHITFAAEPGTGEVVFDGSRLRPSGLTPQQEAQRIANPGTTAAPGYFMTVTSSNSGVTISGKTIQNFANGGIRIAGKPGDRVSNVTVKNNTFKNLGSKHTSGGIGYGGVHVTNSSGTVIQGNTFFYLENKKPDVGKIHGIYLANYTNSSKITNNRFGYVSGDPVRTRNNSKNNVVQDNRFWRSGTYAIFSDWRFKTETCGKGNVFKNNTVGRTSYYNKKFGSGVQGEIPIKVWLHGHDATKKANLGGCSPAPIKSGGGNKYVTKRPW